MPLKDKQIEKKRSYFVVKDNALITKSRYSLSLQQQKILLYFISRIKPNDEQHTMYELSVKDFAKVCGYVEDSGYYYQSIKTDIKKLRDVSSWIEVEPGREVLFSWIDRAEIDRHSGTLRVSFHSTVAPYLFELSERYTQYSLANVLCLSHKYSIRLYEFLYSMQYKKEFEMPIDELRKRIDAENYSRFCHFNDRVLKPSIQEIDQFTDLNVEYAFRKTGRTITHIIFKYHPKSKPSAVDAAQRQKFDPESRKQNKRVRQQIEERIEQMKRDAEAFEREENARTNAIQVEGGVTGQMTIDELPL